MAVTGPLRRQKDEARERRESKKAAKEPEEIGARHILVMHAESHSKPEGVHRTKEDARARAKECLLKLREGLDFVKMVEAYSDEPGAVERGGSLGVFRRDVMVKDFADAAFSLDVGEVSEIVETSFGFHIIERTK